ncbi:hypothetical protein DXN04_29730 [Chitinophaga silvisoli]|uniref:Teneurin NHL domain-containing protein n=2 Tax=Chitinophaga silvisoli TaxID=2291814 RepID=A0A3E1NU80_9BACT|nr:hypothetical protein DXN04_29730 [Chitinophaga silvisoli]
MTPFRPRILLFLFGVTIIWSCSKSPVSDTEPPSPEPPITGQTVIVSTMAGVNTAGSLEGIMNPVDLACDPAGNVYISDPFNNIIAKLDTKGKLSLLAGKYSKYQGGYANGTGANAMFNYQQGIVADAAGNVFVTDYSNRRIRKITADGVVTTIAGSGKLETTDGVGVNASFSFVTTASIDATGNLYVLDMHSDPLKGTDIRKITPSGEVTTIVSGISYSGTFGGMCRSAEGDFYIANRLSHLIYKVTKAGVLSVFAGSGSKGSDDGKGTAASFSFPTGITSDAAGNIYVSDQGTFLIRKITPDGTVSTIAGSGEGKEKDGLGRQASFNFPSGMVTDPAGNIYVADTDVGTIRKITSDGMVTTVVGKRVIIDGDAKNATFNRPTDLVTDAEGNLFVADAGNNVIRQITTAGIVSTYAGTGLPGNSDGPLKTASFSCPLGIALDGSGNLFIADSANNLIRKISNRVVSSIPLFVAANGESGPDNYPTGVAVDHNGYIYYYNSTWNTICQIKPDVISTFSEGSNSGPNNGMAYLKAFGVETDKQGNVYVADAGNSRIAKIFTTGFGIPLAGAVTPGNSPIVGNSNGTGTNASFNHPKGVAVDTAGNVYVADTDNNLIRKITPEGVVTTIAGTGTVGNTDGDGKTATFNRPSGVTVNAAGTVIYIADTGNNQIRKIEIK